MSFLRPGVIKQHKPNQKPVLLENVFAQGDKVSMETYTYPYKQLRKIKVAIYNHQVDSLFMCGLMSAVVMCQERREYGHTWHWMSLFTQYRCY